MTAIILYVDVLQKAHSYSTLRQVVITCLGLNYALTKTKMVSCHCHNKNVLTVMLVFQILFIFAKIKADDSKPRYVVFSFIKIISIDLMHPVGAERDRYSGMIYRHALLITRSNNLSVFFIRNRLQYSLIC